MWIYPLCLRAAHDGLVWAHAVSEEGGSPPPNFERMVQYLDDCVGAGAGTYAWSFSEIFRYLRGYIYEQEDRPEEEEPNPASPDASINLVGSSPYTHLKVGTFPAASGLIHSQVYSGRWVGFGVGVPRNWWESGSQESPVVPLRGSTEEPLTGIAGTVVGWDDLSGSFLVYLPEGGTDTGDNIYQLPYPYLTDMRLCAELVSIMTHPPSRGE